MCLNTYMMGLCHFLSVCVSILVAVNFVTSCSDLDSTACSILQHSQPTFCATSPLAQSACQKYCGNCPVRCFHCPTHSVQDYKTCNNVTTCLPDENHKSIHLAVVCRPDRSAQVPCGAFLEEMCNQMPKSKSCMINTLVGHDGHIEHIMSCGSKQYCDGFGFGFIGKRDAQSRDVSLHCCNTDLCNTPNYHTTLPAVTVPPTTSAPVRNCHRDIVFVIDESSSIGANGFRYAIDYVIRVVTSLDISIHGDQVSLLLYDVTPHIQWYLNEYVTKSDLLTALTYVPYHNGQTRTDIALQFTREHVLQFANGDRPSAKNAVIILTDGQSNAHANTVTEANKLHTADTTVIAIGLGDGSSRQELQDLATDYNHALLAHVPQDLIKAVPVTLNLLC